MYFNITSNIFAITFRGTKNLIKKNFYYNPIFFFGVFLLFLDKSVLFLDLSSFVHPRGSKKPWDVPEPSSYLRYSLVICSLLTFSRTPRDETDCNKWPLMHWKNLQPQNIPTVSWQDCNHNTSLLYLIDSSTMCSYQGCWHHL